MSKLQEARKKRREKGEARRATFHPEPTGKPTQVYHWWASNGGNAPARENFCHYWRVIVFWAPLLWLSLWRERHARLLGIILGVMAVAGLVVTCAELKSVFTGVLINLGALYTLCGLGIGVNAVFEFGGASNATHRVYRSFKRRHPWILRGLTVLTLPGAVVGILGVCLFALLLNIIDSKPVKRTWRWFAKDKLLCNLTPVELLVLALLLTVLVVPPFFGVWVFVLGAVGCVVSGATMASLGAYADNRKKRNAAMRREANARLHDEERELAIAALEPVFRVLFEMLHPEAAHSEPAFLNWCRRYIAYAESVTSDRVWDNVIRFETRLPTIGFYRLNPDRELKIREHLSRARARLLPDIVPPNKPLQPSWWKRFASGTGDFFALAWQILVINKWRICPLVEFDQSVAKPDAE